MRSLSSIGPPPIWLWNLGLAVPRSVLSCWWTPQLCLAANVIYCERVRVSSGSEISKSIWNCKNWVTHKFAFSYPETPSSSSPSHQSHFPRAAALRLSQWVGVTGRRRPKAAAAPDEPRWGDKKYELCLTTSIWGSCSEQEKWQFLLSVCFAQPAYFCVLFPPSQTCFH